MTRRPAVLITALAVWFALCALVVVGIVGWWS